MEWSIEFGRQLSTGVAVAQWELVPPFRNCNWNLPGSPVVETLCFHCRGCGFDR